MFGKIIALPLRVLRWIDSHSPFVVALSTAVLAVITWQYLEVTRQQRLLMEKSIRFDMSPKVFIKTIKPTIKVNFKENTIEINTKVVFSNCGKTEGRNCTYSYKYTIDDEERYSDSKGPFQYIFPNQIVEAGLKSFAVPYPPEIIKKFRQISNKKKKLTIDEIEIPPGLMKRIGLDITLEYEDLEGAKSTYPYSYVYLFHENTWAAKSMSE